jgi:hypothetical protein
MACAVACAISLSAAAHAAPEGPPTPERVRARSLYGQGEKLLKAGDLEAAEHAFVEAYQTMPNAVVLLKVAECRTKRGDFPGAVETLEKYLAERANAPDRASVEDRIAEMRRKPGTVTVNSTPAGAAIWVDGTDTGLVTPSDVELAPGEHRLALKLLPYKPTEQSVIVEFGSKKAVALTLAEPEPVAHQQIAGGSQATTAEAEPKGSRDLSPVFWVAVGVTAAGAAATTVFGIMALNKHSEFEKNPSNETADEGERAALIADISLGVAAAGAVTATVLFFTAGRDKPAEHAFSVVPVVGPTGGGLVGNARF